MGPSSSSISSSSSKSLPTMSSRNVAFLVAGGAHQQLGLAVPDVLAFRGELGEVSQKFVAGENLTGIGFRCVGHGHGDAVDFEE